MNDHTFTRVFCIVLLACALLAGCAPEENDLIPPDAEFTGSVATPTTNQDATVSGTMEVGSTVTVDIIPAPADHTLTQDPLAGTWSLDLVTMPEGDNLILVSVADAVGNVRTLQLTITVDLTGPEVTIEQYPQVARPGSFSFAGTVGEFDSTVFVEVFDALDVSTGISGAAATDMNIWSVDLDLSLLVDGDYKVVATGTDRLGNLSATPAEQVLSLAAANPALTISAPGLPPVLDTDTDQVQFVGSTDPGNTLLVAPVSILNGPDGAGAWDATLSALAAGKKIVTFDVNGGATLQKVMIVRDQTAPSVVEWTSPTASSIRVQFTESMDFTTIEPENLTVEATDETVLNVLAVAQDSDRIYTFTTDAMIAGTTYVATLQIPETCPVVDGCTLEDGRGNSLASAHLWTFKK